VNNRLLLVVAIALAVLLLIGVILASTGFRHGERATPPTAARSSALPKTSMP
jgi:hypothetical protein